MSQEYMLSDSLLAKYLQGEATDQEQAFVEGWIQSSEKNREYYRSVRLLWQQSAHVGALTGIPEDVAWQRFQQKNSPKVKKPAINWAVAASFLPLLSLGIWAVGHFQPAHEQAASQISAPVKPITPQPAPEQKPPAASLIAKNTSSPQVEKTGKLKNISINNGTERNTRRTQSIPTAPDKMICNSTPCPFEICIVQKVNCKDQHPSEFASCSVLQPDQSGKLHYRSIQKPLLGCEASIDEIRITRLNTGETIVLNDHSTPSTAQDFFNHLTGKEKGAVIAGKFHTDCNNAADDCQLAFDGRYGDLVLE